MDAVKGQGEVTLKQDDVFDLSIPGKKEDYVGKGKAISVYSDPTFSPQNVSRTEILDFGNEGFLLNNLLTRDECVHIIQEGEKIGFEPIENGRLDYRSSERILLRCPELSELLYKRTEPFLGQVTIDGEPTDYHVQGVKAALQGTWTPIGLNEIWRLCRYYPEGHFAPHFDGHFVRNQRERSLKTFMVYLNADFTGGTTNFVQEGQQLYKDDTGKFCAEEKKILCRLQPLEGQAIVFNHHRLHEGGRLKSGVKYILRTDLMYRRCDDGRTSPREERAILLLQDAERCEENGESTRAAELYRQAFKLSPSIAEQFRS
ncbi:uncharacterized protein LOC135468167 [Liolophura sinensis]|uniref:uncharacterized protein LOC135468167 n=1 Tax=Liolophura sinensis TaxID=3198878 RepID=UPI0031581D5D